MALATMTAQERLALIQYDQFASIWREIDDGDINALRNNQNLPFLINDKQKGMTPLFLAIKRKRVDMILLLLANGADPNIICKDTSPLWLACFLGLTEVVHPLLDNGADANVLCSGASALHVAAARGLIEVCDIMLNFERGGVDVNVSSERLGTAMHVATSKGHKFVLEVLLQHKPDLNATNKAGETILHIACRLNLLDFLTLILKSKLPIDPFAKEKLNGATAAHLTTNVKMLKTLLDRWPSLLYSTDSFGRTPTFYMPFDILPILTSLNSKQLPQHGTHLYDSIESNFADIFLLCQPDSLKPNASLHVPGLSSGPDSSPGHSPRPSIEEALSSQLSTVQVSSSTATVKIPCHKAMLWSRIPWFIERLVPPKTFTPSSSAGASQNVEELEVPEVSAGIMRVILFYVYTDQLRCGLHELDGVLKAAELFGMRRLVQLVKSQRQPNIEVMPSTYVADMANLSASGAFADVEITCGADAKPSKFSVHRFRLAPFSEYFATMFSVGLRETQTGIIDLPDISGVAFTGYLYWLYTFTLSKRLDKLQYAFELLELVHHFMTLDLSFPLQTKILETLKQDSFKGTNYAICEADRLDAVLVYEQCALRYAQNILNSAEKDAFQRTRSVSREVLEGWRNHIERSRQAGRPFLF